MIYVSSSCLAAKKIGLVVETLALQGLNKIELSGGTDYYEGYADEMLSLKQKYNLSFLLHNYFPPPVKPFVVNLASNDPSLLALSIEHCRAAISLAAKLESPIYGLHAGFCFNAQPSDLGREIEGRLTISKERAKAIFVRGVQELADYAAGYDISLAIENNVLTSSNLTNGKNKLLLGVTPRELLDIVRSIDRKNVAALIDLGHLKVSAQTLGFSRRTFVQEVAPLAVEFHLSDNKGCIDEHGSISEGSWFWDSLKRWVRDDAFFTLEVRAAPIGRIVHQVKIITENFERTRRKVKAIWS